MIARFAAEKSLCIPAITISALLLVVRMTTVLPGAVRLSVSGMTKGKILPVSVGIDVRAVRLEVYSFGLGRISPM